MLTRIEQRSDSSTPALECYSLVLTLYSLAVFPYLSPTILYLGLSLLLTSLDLQLKNTLTVDSYITAFRSYLLV